MVDTSMTVILRHTGERTAPLARALLERAGYDVAEVHEAPFSEAIRVMCEVAIGLGQRYTVVIDGDVIPEPVRISHALRLMHDDIFCLDGFTMDKTFGKARRAGVHIYTTRRLREGSKHVQDNQIKPESHMRKKMDNKGYRTIAPKDVVFGDHGYHQYYADLYRTAYIQARKLPRKVAKSWDRWQELQHEDADFRVIIAGVEAGRRAPEGIVPDASQDYGTDSMLRKLGLSEKEPIDVAARIRQLH